MSMCGAVQATGPCAPCWTWASAAALFWMSGCAVAPTAQDAGSCPCPPWPVGQEARKTEEPTSPPGIPVLAEVEAVVTAVSRPRRPEQLGVYINGFFMVKYEVRKVLSGELEARVIQVVHQSVKARKALPAAAIQPGEVHRLALASWEQADRHYGQFAMDDRFVDIETPVFYVMSWGTAK